MADVIERPLPLNLDWNSPRGKAHHKAMCRLRWNDPVAIAHFENIGKPHPATLQKSFIEARQRREKHGEPK